MERQGRQRVAMNEATFRKVNEGMEAGQDPSGLLVFVCERDRLGCNKLIQLTRAEYEGIRENPRRFAILDGTRSSKRNGSSSDTTSTSWSRRPAIRRPRSSSTPTRAGRSTDLGSGSSRAQGARPCANR